MDQNLFRDRVIYEIAKMGMSSARISKIFNVSAPRVAQICKGEENNIRLISTVAGALHQAEDWREVPIRCFIFRKMLENCLVKMGYHTLGELFDELENGNFNRHLPIKNFGEACLNELEQWADAMRRK